MHTVIFLASALPVCGFYAYVLVQLYREEKRHRARKNRLQEHLYELEPETPSARAERIVRTAKSRIALRNRDTRGAYERPRLNPTVTIVPGSTTEALARRETVISLVLGVGGLAALFAGIELFNSLVAWTL